MLIAVGLSGGVEIVGAEPCGERFLHYEIRPGSSRAVLWVPGLKRECSVELAEVDGGFGEILVVGTRGDAHRIRGPEDLVGCVKIESEGEALEYLRFYSSDATFHLFGVGDVELYRVVSQEDRIATGCPLVLVTDSAWQRIGLSEASVRTVEGAYEIARCTKRFVGNERPPCVFERVVTRVNHDGKVTEMSRKRIPLRSRDGDLDIPEGLPLGFPGFEPR